MKRVTSLAHGTILPRGKTDFFQGTDYRMHNDSTIYTKDRVYRYSLPTCDSGRKVKVVSDSPGIAGGFFAN